MSTATLPPITPLTRKISRLIRKFAGARAVATTRFFPPFSLFFLIWHQARKFVVVTGIGCSSRFPYYMNTFGFHTVHGRAPAVATGIKAIRRTWKSGSRPAMAVPSPSAAIACHMLRRNVGLKVLLFNNRIYGLTKGQYSPTSGVR